MNSSLERAGELFNKVLDTKPMTWIEATREMAAGHTLRRRSWASIVVGVRHPTESESTTFRGKRKNGGRFFALVCQLRSVRASKPAAPGASLDLVKGEVSKAWTPYIDDFDASDWEVVQ